MYIVIIGCGKVGSALASELSANGNDISIIDNNQKNLEKLGSGFNGTRIRGIEFDEDILKSAGIESADVFLAMTQDDNINIMAAQMAKKIFNVPKVIARVFDPRREFVYNKLGIETTNPTGLWIELIKGKMFESKYETIKVINTEYALIEIEILKDIDLSVYEFEKMFSCIVSSVIRQNKLKLSIKDFKIEKYDKVICTISFQKIEKLIEFLQEGEKP